MSTLYGNLESIYQNSSDYDKYFTLNEIYPLIRMFFTQKVQLNEKYLDPFEFANIYKIDINFALEIFLALSKDNVTLNKYYCIECDNCNSYIVTDDVKNIIECEHCGYTLSTEEGKYIFQRIRFIFSIQESVKCELEKHLKNQPSSSFKLLEEEGSPQNDPPLIKQYPETDKALDEFREALNNIMKRV